MSEDNHNQKQDNNSKYPNFISQIPDYLLSDLPPADKWVIENINVINQKMDWQTNKLNNIEVQTMKTNGRVTNLEENVVILQKNAEDDKNVIDKVKFIYNLSKTLVTNNFFWIAFVFLFVLSVQYIAGMPLGVNQLIKFFFNL